jgi:hypothetical protein
MLRMAEEWMIAAGLLAQSLRWNLQLLHVRVVGQFEADP